MNSLLDFVKRKPRNSPGPVPWPGADGVIAPAWHLADVPPTLILTAEVGGHSPALLEIRRRVGGVRHLHVAVPASAGPGPPDRDRPGPAPRRRRLGECGHQEARRSAAELLSVHAMGHPQRP